MPSKRLIPKGGIERMSVVLADMLFRLGHQIYFICWKKTSDVKLNYPLSYMPSEIWNEDNDKFLEKFISENNIELLINQAAILPRDNFVSLLFRREICTDSAGFSQFIIWNVQNFL